MKQKTKVFYWLQMQFVLFFTNAHKIRNFKVLCPHCYSNELIQYTIAMSDVL